MIQFEVKGNFGKATSHLRRLKELDFRRQLEKFGREGVAALSAGTPIDSGQTAGSWDYEITGGKDSFTISWTNSHVNQGVNIAVILQYGHGTRNGGYVQGRDYINPAMRPIFDRIAETSWKAVTSL